MSTSHQAPPALGSVSAWGFNPGHPDFAPYWAGCVEERLLVPVCEDGHAFWPPRATCSRCFNPTVKWVETDGRGSLYSWTVVHRTRNRELAAMVPYVVGMITLAGTPGIRMVGRVDVDPGLLVDGLELDVVFSELRHGVRLPMWRPRSMPLKGATRSE
jgi:uncharacterized OB-fold protein